jgi:RNA polymerase sigma factor (sigma-70 family)
MNPPETARLISENQGLVVHLAKFHQAAFCPRVRLADLIAAGKIGLAKAAKRFDSSRGTKFSTYSAWWIRKHMFTALKGGRLRGLRLDRRFSERGDIEGEGVFQEFLTSDGRLLGRREVAGEWKRDQERRDAGAELMQWFRRVITDADLDGREREIITLRYGVNGNKKKTQKQIARTIGVTRRRIGQIEKGAREKLYAWVWKNNSF